MNKKYLMNGLAALAIVAGISSCTKDVTAMSPVDEAQKAKENAELQLGFVIPDGQTWDMASQVTANISVNLGLDQEYTVAVYDKNPLFNSSAKFFAMETVKEGKALSTSFTLPNSLEKVYVATYDSKNRSVVNTVDVKNGQIVANIGGASAAATSRAAENASVYPDYVKTLDNYLNPSLADINAILSKSDQTKWMVDQNKMSLGTAPTLDAMKAYPAITDDIIANETSNKNHNLSDKSWFYNPEDFPAHGDGKHYRVAADTEVKEVFHINGTQYVINDAVIYVEGILHLNGNTLNGPTLVVAPGGKIILDGKTDMSNAGRIVVMAGGSLVTPEGKSADLFVNNGAACYNAGTINIKGELNVNGSDFYNNGTIVVDVLRNTSGGKFTNFGHITARTNTIQGDAYNSTIVNGCYLHFTENAGTGPLTLLDNSRIDCDGQLYMTGASTMYNLSEINAGSIYCQNATINGPTAQGTFSIVKTSKFLVSHGGDLYVKNNAYVDCDPDEFYNYQNKRYKDIYNDNDYKYQAAYYIINNNIAHWTSENSSAIIIPEGDCTGMGNNPGGGGGKIYGDPAVYTYAFEDQTLNTDYDMNDVVLKVSYAVEEEGTGENEGKVIYDKSNLVVELVALGATYEITAKIGNADLFEGKELHAAMKQKKGIMINTGGTGGNSISGVPTQKCTVAVPAGWNGKFAELPVSIKVSTTNKTYAFPNDDVYPHVIMVPTDWAWPTERTNIKNAYAGTTAAKEVKITYTATYTNKETNELVTSEFTNKFRENSFAAWATSPAESRNATMNGWFNNPTGDVMTNTNNNNSNN